MLDLVPFAVARNSIDFTGQFLNDPSLLEQAIELAATNGDHGSLINFQSSIGRNSALMEATHAITALAGFERSLRERRARPSVPAPAPLPSGPVNELVALMVTGGVETILGAQRDS